ncbi:MAG: hypothetical protein AB7S38_21235 [Vulcanimicrobiota bacterium]
MSVRPLAVWFYIMLLVGMAWGAPLPFSPARGETVTDPRPTVSVDLPNQGNYDHSSARMWFNGREVSAQCLKTPLFVSFRPLSRMEAGSVTVRFSIADLKGQREEWEWSFQVEPRGRIESIHHSAKSELGEYDELVVDMVAEPGGQAWFTLGQDSHKFPMTEGETGHYQGTYLVKPGDYKMGVPVIGHLQLGPTTDTIVAEPKVIVFGHIFRVRVDEPKSGSKMPLNFKIKGRTRPGAKVTAVANIGFDNSVSPPNTITGEGGTGGIEARADKDGFFEMEYGVPLKLPNMRAALAIFATDDEGQRSVPTILNVHF